MPATRFRGAICAACAILAIAAPAPAQTIWGTSTVALSQNDAFEGYWEYCLDIAWDTSGGGGQGMSHTSIFLGLEECVCACEPGYFAFVDTAGYGSGTAGQDSCTAYYHGDFLCDGDPLFPEFPFPTVKFEYFEYGCEPDGAGWARLCFYSLFASTDTQTFPDALGIKYGSGQDTGDLVGELPECFCGSPVEAHTWGVIKAIYR